MRPSYILCCAAALWLALAGPARAQIGGLVPETAGVPAQPAASKQSATKASSQQQPAAKAGVQPAAHQETAPVETAQLPGEPYYDEGSPILTDDWEGGPLGLDGCGLEGCGPGGCNFCGQRSAGCGPFGNGCFSGLYVRGEYLLWSTQGMNLPPLVTTSPPGTAQANAGILGLATTQILFGNEVVGDDMRSGGRLVVGWWFDPCRRLGIEADAFSLGDERTAFDETSGGNPILGRPFFDVVQGIQNLQLVAFPNLIQGSVAASHDSSFHGSGTRVMYNLACGEGGGSSWFTHCPVHTGYRFDLLVGYRYLGLDDRVSIVEDSLSLDAQNPGAFFIRDVFDTENQFHGTDVGTSFSFCKGCWSLELLSKIALGNTRSTTTISGSTVVTQGAIAETFTGGILAQRTNIGVFEDDEFAVVPELGVTLGYQLNPCWRATVGYSFIYWSRVARAGDQIDLNVNPNLFPPEGPPLVTTNLRPEFDLLYTDLWAQGLNLGIEGRW